jgi:putative membrane protein
MFRLLLHWVLSAVSLILIANFLPGVRVDNFRTALIVAAVYGILHVVLFNILAIIAFIPMFLTFGLFGLIINAFLLFLTDKLVTEFKLANLGVTLVAAVLLTLLNNLWRWILP